MPIPIAQRPASILVLILTLPTAVAAGAETGADLWLRYRPLPRALSVSGIVVEGTTATDQLVRDELRRGLSGLAGTEVPLARTVGRDGFVVVGTPAGSPVVAGLGLARELAELGDEGFLIRDLEIGEHRATVVASASEIGALYGAFHLLRLLQYSPRRPRGRCRFPGRWRGSTSSSAPGSSSAS